MRTAERRHAVALLGLILILAGLAPGATAAGDPVLVGAGDIAACGNSGDSATAKLVAAIPGTVYTTGDNVYDDGTLSEFRTCYEPTWGLFKARTRPTIGNHEYHTSGAKGHFDYFGWRAGVRGEGYFAYNLGSWRIYGLNSNCGRIGCGPTSRQVQWLKRDLAANPRRCVLAYWHHPMFSSGEHGNTTAVRAFWDVLYAARADVILNGHDHDYERFERQTPWGVARTYGIRQFVVGTGGKSLRPFGTIKRNSITRNSTAFGVLKLTLHPTTYDWEFVPVAGQTWRDRGWSPCRT